MKIIPRNYLQFKLLNSLFAGASMASVFVIYAQIEPAVFSFGGIVLAFATIFIAKFYSKIMKIKIFFALSLSVEIAMMIAVLLYLSDPISAQIALLIYLCYQIMFLFGGYIVRFETLALRKIKLLSMVDVRKQIGYLAGLFVSFAIYKSLEIFTTLDKTEQVWWLHIFLLLLQSAVIAGLARSFGKRSL